MYATSNAYSLVPLVYNLKTTKTKESREEKKIICFFMVERRRIMHRIELDYLCITFRSTNYNNNNHNNRMIVIKSKQSTSRTTLCLLVQIISYFIYIYASDISAHVFFFITSLYSYETNWRKRRFHTPNIILFFIA